MKSGASVHIVDGPQAERESLRRLLESARISVTTYGSAEEFLAESGSGPLGGCLLLDVPAGAAAGLVNLERLRASGCSLPIVFLTRHGDVRTAVRAARAGAFEVLEKPFLEEELIRRIRQAIALDRELSQGREERSEEQRRLHSLTPRERSVLDLLVEGKISKQIAGQLGITRRTVEKHRERIRRKLGAENLADLVRITLSASEGETGSDAPPDRIRPPLLRDAGNGNSRD